jgi:uncharacterized iron-regulated protein
MNMLMKNRSTFGQALGGVHRLWGFICMGCLAACAAPPATVHIQDIDQPLAVERIWATDQGAVISQATLLDELAQVQIIYIGERHDNPEHHRLQLALIQALHQRNPALIVGMEMFAFTYQDVLDRWSAGALDESAFLEQTHWYANWRFNFALYRPVLAFIQSAQIPLYGLNIPFHIPAKIAVGGLENLAPAEKALLPDEIDLTRTAHREYVRRVFDRHHIRGRENFDYFYAAQCVWEDTMAATIARHLNQRQMVVLAGNGHIVQKFGIPDRAHKRTGAAFRTVMLAQVGDQVARSDADYIWATSSVARHP